MLTLPVNIWVSFKVSPNSVEPLWYIIEADIYSVWNSCAVTFPVTTNDPVIIAFPFTSNGALILPILDFPIPTYPFLGLYKKSGAPACKL